MSKIDAEKMEKCINPADKMASKMIPKSTFGRSGVRLLRFLAVFWGMRFLMSFGMYKKVNQKQQKFDTWAANTKKAHPFWEAQRNERGRRGEF